MANTPKPKRDEPPGARILVIGIVQVNEATELRFVREPWGWRPDIVVNMVDQTVSPAPDCFQPDDFVLAALDIAWDRELIRIRHQMETGHDIP